MANTTAHALHPPQLTSKHINFLIVSSVMIFLSTLVVVLRFIQRTTLVRSEKRFWWDDWFILAALLCAYGNLGGGIADKYTGYHITEYAVEELNDFSKVIGPFAKLDLHKPFVDLMCLPQNTLAEETLYNASVALSKASLLFFYSRIFSVDKTLLLIFRIVGFIVFGYCMAADFGLIFAKHPVEAQWNVTQPHTSINDMAFWISMAVINICLDITILAIPQIKVRKLHMSRRRRMAVQGVFLLGAL